MSGPTILQQPTPPPESTSIMTSVCTHCGNNIPTIHAASHRIKDLEAQVHLLNAKASAAVDKIADYEDEIKSLRSAYAKIQQEQQAQQQQQSQISQQQQQPQPPPPPPSQLQTTVPSPPPIDQTSNPPNLTPTPTATTPNPSSPPRSQSRLASLSSFLPGRKRDTALLSQTPNTPSSGSFPQNALQPLYSGSFDRGSTPEPSSQPQQQQQPLTLLSLQASLENERTLRLRAESNLTQTQTELEELTASLFGQANEMVAQERKARAKLEERVKVLEDRDGEKRRRLERLERALERIERVRGLVGQKGDGEIRIAFGTVGDAGLDKDRLRVINNVTARG